jgi:hypothetical protein
VSETRYLYLVKDGEFEVVKRLQYVKPPPNEGIEQLSKNLDVVKFMEARHEGDK